jgi:cell division protein FtsW
MDATCTTSLPVCEDEPRLALGGTVAGQGLILATLALIGLGAVVVYSSLASVEPGGAWYSRVSVRHGMFAALAVVVLLVGWRVPWRWLAAGGRVPVPALAILLVSLVLGAMVFVPGIGYQAGGKFRWIRLGPRQYSIGLQPSELIKFAVILFVAMWLTRPGRRPRKIGAIAVAILAVLGPLALIVTQDFGTAVLIGLAGVVTMFLAGVPWWVLSMGIPPAAAGAWYFIVMAPYRMYRIAALLDPWNSTSPAAYHAQQSLLSILAGGWRGVGLGLGVRKMGYLPEDSTDFVFASFCEEWGFRGTVLLLCLLAAWLWNCRRVVRQVRDPRGRVLAAGLGSLVLLQAVLHIGVNLVVLPPTGMAMPFLSAGGTGLVLMATATALIVSIAAHDRPDELAPQPEA